MKKTRVAWIDIARGIGILLVVYGHSLSADSFRFLIYSFHMPLFFFLSGLVFKYKPEETYTVFLRKNARNILIPYALFAVLSFGLWCITKYPTPQTALFQFGSIFFGNGNNGLLAFNNILWFLPCLFITRVGFFTLTRISGKRTFLLLALGVFSLVGYGYALLFPNLKLFFGIETALTAVVFLGLGYLLTTLTTELREQAEKYALPLSVLFFSICVLGAILNFQQSGVQVDLRKDLLHNYGYFYLASLSGIAGTIYLSMSIKKQILLEYLGKQSLVIFAWHLLAFPYVSKLIAVTHAKPLFQALPEFVSPIFYSICSIIIVLIIAVPVQYAAKSLGRRAKG